MNSFFKNQGPFDLDFLISKTVYIKKKKYNNFKIYNISTLDKAKQNEISFFDNVKYADQLTNTKACSVLIKEEHLSLLEGKKTQPIISKNPLNDFILIANAFYPDANTDDTEIMLKNKYKKYLKKNTIIDDRTKIGKNFNVGANTTIKKNVIIGNNVRIGSNCSISNSIIEDNVIINDGTIIGKIGFGFKLIKDKMFFIPHIGSVKIGKSVYIGGNCTIDRGSFSDTVIEDGTMLDNQVHIAHNCKIGKNCFLAGQVGIAGSSIIGNHCMIGGQAGISGHLKIGNNVYIGGGSGVIKDVEDGKKVMGYPASDFKTFIRRDLKSD